MRINAMAERVKNSALPRVLSEVVGDLADLFQKELRLLKAEVSEKLSIAAYGIALHWSCLIVAAIFAAVGAAAFAKGRADAREELAPTRTIENVKQDIATAKEQLT
jgi:hypothetical protein